MIKSYDFTNVTGCRI